MALGFGFNKAKVLSAAEKHVQKGKLQNAISEYEKVAREDPRDLTVLNTIGDLYARLGQTDRAMAYFRKVGDAYAAEGFTVKAIAMYKKLTKLAPQSIDGLQKLAELYTQQGLYNDARQQYVVLADRWMKANDLEGAARVFQKMLELDPENAAMQSKLADLYIRMGKKEDAKEIYFRAAESLYQRAAMDAADEALGRILSIDAGNSRALLKRAVIALDSGDGASAIRHLERFPQLDSNPDALGILLRAQLINKNLPAAETIARNLVTQHNDLSGIQAIAEFRMATGSHQEGLALYREFSGQLSLSNTESLQHALEAALHRVHEDAPSLEIVRELYRKLGDKGHINECTELLAHALVHTGDLKRARDLYRELAESEPENPMHEQNYRQVLAKLGEDAAVRPLSAAEGEQAFMVDELEISAPALVQEYPDAVAYAIKTALTDSELFNSYNVPDKAIAPLEHVLSEAPRDVRLNQRLASLYAAANRFADAAQCCEILQAVYLEAGLSNEAGQYRDMAAKYAERAGIAAPLAQAAAASAAPTAEFAVESAPSPYTVEVESAPAAPSEAPAPLPAQEIDISEEWETQAAEPVVGAAAPVAVATPPAPTLSEMLDEIRFYISQGMWKEARVACERFQAVAPGHPELSELEAQISAALAPAIEVEGPADFGISMEPAAAAVPAAPPEAPPAVWEPVAPAAKSHVLGDFVSDLEQSLGNDFAVAGAAPVPVKVAAPPVAPAAQAAPSAIPQEVREQASTVLSDMFAEFKEDAEAGASEVEDPDTHYNLGVAFREMGLLDEAIGELQKVCLAIDKGVPFTQTMQAYTWLAQCLVDKGVPGASFRWYQKALTIATDEQQRMSINYDLAAAYEAAGNHPAALQHFMEVYGSNIDYRDVAERIKALRS